LDNAINACVTAPKLGQNAGINAGSAKETCGLVAAIMNAFASATGKREIAGPTISYRAPTKVRQQRLVLDR
jgi:hypothetical protein